ncbi:MAG: hypothetical protein ABR582_08250 [Gemmatimonadaceae bacterium]
MIEKLRVGLLGGIVLLAACSADTLTTVPGRPLQDQGSSSMPEATPDSLRILPNEVVGGGPGSPSGTVYVGATTSFDRFLHVTSNNPQVLPFLPSGTTLAANTTRANVQIIPQQVSARTVVTVFVTGNGVTVSADLIVDPPGTPPPPPSLSSFVVNPSTVDAGVTATGTVTLPTAAPSGGLVVALSSRIPKSASVPPSVTVPAGATQVSFPISTFAGFPNSTTSFLLSASNANTVINSSITVVTGGTTTSPLPAPSPVSPNADQRFAAGSIVTFDWTDVANSASYEIQIDDKDTFPAPLVASANVTSSEVQIANLPTRTMWWRVRGIASDGTIGSWSGVRRFELK